MGTFFRELWHVGIYKRSQGRIVRQLTFAALAVTIALGLWRLGSMIAGWQDQSHLGLRYMIPGVLLAIGLWVSYRAVNVPIFADFLIAVEAEMNKVSWPTRGELGRASTVVLILIIAFACILTAFDFLWKLFFVQLGIG